MTDSTDKMTIKALADELGITKNTVRNYLVKAGYDLARYKKNGIILLDKELIGVARSIYRSIARAVIFLWKKRMSFCVIN
ncbi:hypothetical protein [Enterococcus faecium]|uniref:hypothetical protein n=1 Tax=Enterococcus faecium TaxID=1352 RepID=UPI0001B6F9E3|nr:hypothetical protein [Enterococcus faecium]EEV43525.1 conserved hypothetical protein [Enterococcus faecium 1,230,933]